MTENTFFEIFRACLAIGMVVWITVTTMCLCVWVAAMLLPESWRNRMGMRR